jgi:hypothetical protein
MLPAISHNCHDSWMQRRTESFLCIAKNDDSIGALRKALSILLLAMFCLPAITPLFALQAQEDANLPACCRRHGKHHCMMSMQDRQAMTASQDPQFAAPTEKCPYAPSMVVRGVHLSSFVPQPGRLVTAEIFGHPAGIIQTESKLRTSEIRSRQKRGPPVVSTL